MDTKPILSITPEGNIYREGEARPVPIPVDDAPKLTKKERQDIVGWPTFWERIPDEDAAVAFVEEVIWGDDGPQCPKCQATNVYMPASGKPMRWRCRKCKRYFSVRVGTTLEETNLPLRKWLMAIHIMLGERKGESSVRLSEQLEISQYSAWFLEHRIREAMRPDYDVFSGVVEVDEMYVGGKERWKHGDKKLHDRWRDGKVAVIGIKEHAPGGRVLMFPVFNADNDTLLDMVLEFVVPGSTVYTDGHDAYKPLSEMGYHHEVVKHNIGQYVLGDVTTNGIESLWSVFKHGYVGTFHCVSPKHLHRYTSEFAYRQNQGRTNGFKAIAEILRRMVGKRLTYDKLAPNNRKHKKK